jgi:hypothetical protein
MPKYVFLFIFLFIALASLYALFTGVSSNSLENEQNATNAPPDEYATYESAPMAKSTKKKNSRKTKSKSNSRAQAQNKKKQTAKNISLGVANNFTKNNNYLTCGPGIQACPPPKPKGACSCNAKQNLLQLFDGTQ